MEVEFYQEETGMIKLYSAKNIWIRLYENNK
jgi:hypothetical protein